MHLDQILRIDRLLVAKLMRHILGTLLSVNEPPGRDFLTPPTAIPVEV